MSNEKAIRIKDESGLQLLKGQIRNVHYVWSGKVLFDCGEYVCKALGKTADKIKELEGQTIEMVGQWETLRKYRNTPIEKSLFVKVDIRVRLSRLRLLLPFQVPLLTHRGSQLLHN